MASAQAGGAQETPHALAASRPAAHDQLGPDSAHAGVAVQVVDRADLGGELDVSDRPVLHGCSFANQAPVLMPAYRGDPHGGLVGQVLDLQLVVD
ncbi:MAG: hypothetical protein M3Y48_20360 [Actinomycetota bacterium]|nr:hypothetical protein [Actinomycetota bacterium]